MSTNSLRKRSKAPTPQAPSETFAKILPVQPTIAADSELRTRKFLGVAATAVAVVSCASDWHIARQYENNLLHVVFKMMLNFGITAALALIISYSPTGRAFKPGGPPMKEPKKAVTGAACIMLALWLGFGLFGPCGIVTGLSTTGAAVLLLP